MPTLVLTPRLTGDSNRLERAAREIGWKTHRATRYRLPADLEDPVVYGEMVFCDVMAEQLGLGLLETNDSWLPALPYQYLQREVRLARLRDLADVDGRHFFKPANDKIFEAGIFEHGSHVPHRYLDLDAPILVSEVVSFEVELRGYVLDRQLLTAGIYAFSGMAGSVAPESVFYDQGCAWLQELLDDEDVPLPSAIVVDVGFTSDTGWSVVEANQVYASGVYANGFSSEYASQGANPQQVLKVIERSGGLRSKVNPSDEKWLRPGAKRLDSSLARIDRALDVARKWEAFGDSGARLFAGEITAALHGQKWP